MCWFLTNVLDRGVKNMKSNYIRFETEDSILICGLSEDIRRLERKLRQGKTSYYPLYTNPAKYGTGYYGILVDKDTSYFKVVNGTFCMFFITEYVL